MKALVPSKKNKIIFTFLFSLFLFTLFYFVTTITWKLVGVIVFINLLILSLWLPKTVEQMDERELVIYLKRAHVMFSFMGFIIATVFGLHIVFFQNMTVVEFMNYTGLPIVAVMSYQYYLLKKDLSDVAT